MSIDLFINMITWVWTGYGNYVNIKAVVHFGCIMLLMSIKVNFWENFFFMPRCKTFKHIGELAWGDQTVWLRCERAAHRLYGQFLCWNKILYVGMLIVSMFCLKKWGQKNCPSHFWSVAFASNFSVVSIWLKHFLPSLCYVSP